MDLEISRRDDGSVLMRTPALGPYPARLTDRLEYWAARAPQRILFAQRDASGGWRSVTYAAALESARAVGAYLLEKGLSAERPLAVLSGNDIEHALLELGAMYVGVPYAPVSPAYSLLSSDFAKLRFILDLLTPGLVFANGPQYRRALDAVHVANRLERFEDALCVAVGKGVGEAHAQVGPETIAKFLFTSGSTGMPKAVINTQRMWCSNQAMVASQLAFLQDEPPVLVDWAPWHHTAAGNHDFGLAIYHGGSYYIDEGKPMPGAIETTVRNLREIAPTWYFNVPKGFEALLPYLRSDERLRKNFFSRLKILWFAGAAISQHVFDEIKRLAFETCGEEILFLTGLGSTETAPYAMGRMWETEDATNTGLPAPGMEWKLVPLAGKLEARLKGPNITPGYWRQPELTAAAFDDEGYYRLGDAFVFADPQDPSKGLLFRGRIAEDFKLATGTWVHVGPLRARFIEHFAPLVRDVVFAGEGRNELAALIFPAGNLDLNEVRERLGSFHQGSTGSSNRIARAIVLEEPPSLDAGEMTDKGSINQRCVLERRRQLLEELYRDPPSERVLWI
ncbi:MAG TPA: feruloyl-CoA synthase [Burkholderiales bacterium]|nr:feruloyl-CoA synthase [Burkholderiales bacterium]